MFGFGKKQPKATAPGPSSIVPRIKHQNFLTALQGIDMPPDQMPVTEPFVGDLLVTYAFDMPGMFQMVSDAQLERLGVKREELHAIAIANLMKQITDIGFKGEPPLLLVVTGNDLEACTLLLDGVWEEMTDKMGGDFPGDIVVAAATRSVLLVSSSESEEGLALMAELALAAREREPVHRLSEHFFAWRDGTWEVYS